MLHFNTKRFNVKPAFTLIELLVVIAIIAILAAILFPVFGRARENARRTSCLNNAKQLGLGMMQYAQDYDERIPTGWDTSIGIGWGGRIFPYVKSVQIFQCPSDTVQIGPTYANDYTPVSYAYNMSIAASSFRGVGGFIPAFNSASKTVLLYETTNTLVGITPLTQTGENTSGGYVRFRSPAGNGMSGRLFVSSGGIGGYSAAGLLGGRVGTITTPAPVAPPVDSGNGTLANESGRHLEGSNFLFVDGHAKWLKGASVSAGDAASSATGNQTGTASPYASGASQAAGTANTAFAATFSPI